MSDKQVSITVRDLIRALAECPDMDAFVYMSINQRDTKDSIVKIEKDKEDGVYLKSWMMKG